MASNTPVTAQGPIGAHTAQFENLANILSQIKSADRKSNLLDHVQSVFQELIVHYPKDSLDKFEEVSYLLKQDKNELEKFLKTIDNRNYSQVSWTLKEFMMRAEKQFSRPVA